MGEETAEDLRTPSAPSLFEVAESTLMSAVKPWAVFEAAAARPAPSFAAATGNAVLWLAAFFGINLAHAAIAYPGRLTQAASATGLGPTAVAVAAVAAAGLSIAGMALSAAGIAGLARAMGGTGGFSRGYQAVSMMAVLLPIQALILWVPAAAFIPVIGTGILAAAALEKLMGARATPARVLCGCYVVLVLGSMLVLNFALRRLAAPYAEAARAMEQLQHAGLAGQQPAAGGPSSLGLVSPPADLAEMMSKMSEQDPQAMGQAAGALMGAAQPMLNDPKMLEGLSAEQRQQVQQLSGMLETIQKQMQSGQALDPKQQAQLMELYQKQMGSLQPAAAPGQGQPR